MTVSKNGIPYGTTSKVNPNTNNDEILVNLEGHQCAENTTITPLGINGKFSGSTWQDTLDYGVLSIAVKADVASAIDGLDIQWSNDGVNIVDHDIFTVPADNGKTYTFGPAQRYYRVEYTNNDTAAQTEFALTSILRKSYVKPSSHRISDTIIGEDDAELSKSILAIQTNDETTYRNVDIQNPIPTGTDSVYGADLLLSLSNPGGFTLTDDPTAGNTAILTSFVSNVDREKKDDSVDAVKYVTLAFRRPIVTNTIGIDSGPNGTFSNVKVTIFQGQESQVILDDSADATLKKIDLFNIPPVKFSKILIEFYTTNTITVGLIGIFKNNEVTARIQALNDVGVVTDIAATNRGNLKIAVQEYGDTPSIDAFARLRTSEPHTLFDSKQLHDKQPLFWDEELGNAASSTYVAADACTAMTVTASATDYVIRQTKQRPNYQPGKSQLAFLTFYSPQTSGVTKRIGLFDGTGANNLTPNNGIFYETDGTISWNICKNGTTTETVVQANWNVDPLDGTGPSRKTLDTSAAQIAVIDFEWLGVGRVRVGFVIDGIIFYTHYFNHANDPTYDSVYMSTPNLPIRYDIQSDGVGFGTLDHICSTVMSEGGVEELGVLRSINNGILPVGLTTTANTYALLGLKLKTTYRDVTITPTSISGLSVEKSDILWTLRLNPSIAGTFTYSDLTDSALQTATGVAANIVTGGTIIGSGYMAAESAIAGELSTALKLGTTIAGVSDELVLCAQAFAASKSVTASLTWRELL